MGKKNPIEKVYKLIEDRGFIFIKWLEEYKNNTSKFLLQCSDNKDHQFEFCYAYLKDGLRCPYCFGNKHNDIDFIREEFLKRNYILISTKYTDAHTKLEYICNKHPQKIQSISWNNFKNNKGCRQCGNEKRIEKQLLESKEEVLYAYKNKGLIICDGEEYKGKTKKLKCFCILIILISYRI